MSVGNRVYTKIERPSKELLEEMKKVPVANYDDNMGRIYALDAGIRPFNKTPLCGPAFTVKAPSGDNLMFHKALSMVQEGDVLVIAGVGESERSFCGEIMLQTAIAKKLGGFVIDGTIRDVDAYRAADFPVYARGVQANGPYKNGPGEINVPVACGGQVIMPGDILVGDADGIVVIPRKDAEAVLEMAQKTLAFETELLAKYETENPPTGLNVDGKLAEMNCEIIED